MGYVHVFVFPPEEQAKSAQAAAQRGHARAGM